MPDALSRQIPYIHRVVEAFAIPVIKLAGYEADDLIGTLAAQASSQGLEVVIVTGDKDMFQLLSPTVRIYDPVKEDRKSTRLNSSHGYISYAVFCLKKKK